MYAVCFGLLKVFSQEHKSINLCRLETGSLASDDVATSTEKSL